MNKSNKTADIGLLADTYSCDILNEQHTANIEIYDLSKQGLILSYLSQHNYDFTIEYQDDNSMIVSLSKER